LAHAQAVENVKEKIKSVLPTANVFDPASLQVRPVLAWAVLGTPADLAKIAMRWVDNN